MVGKKKMSRPKRGSRRNAMLATKHRKARKRVQGELRKKRNGRLGF